MRFLIFTYVIFCLSPRTKAHVEITDLCEAVGCASEGGFGIKLVGGGLIGVNDTFSIQAAIQTIQGKIDTSLTNEVNIELISGEGNLRGTRIKNIDKWAQFDDLSFDQAGEYRLKITIEDFGDEFMNFYVDESYNDNLEFGTAKYGLVSVIDESIQSDTFDLKVAVYDSAGNRNLDYYGIGRLEVISGPGEILGTTTNLLQNGFALYKNIHFTEAGEYEIEIILENIIGDTITLDANNIPTHTASLALKRNTISISPNPAQNHANLFFDAKSTGNYSINLIDIVGKKTPISENYFEAGENNLKLEFTAIPNGLYFLEVCSSEVAHNLKILINE